MRALIRLYPRRWRARYGGEFELVLLATPPGVGTVVDVLRGALDAHLRAAAARPGPLLRWALLATCALVVGWLDVHATDDVQPVAAALLVAGFGFGLHRPARAGGYALALFAAVPLAEAFRQHVAGAQPAPPYGAVIALVPALVGAYAGAAVRWGMGRAARG